MMKLSAAAAASLILGCALVGSTPAIATHAGGHVSCPALNHLDPDADGSFSIFEAKRRARTVFDALNTDGDQTLEADETHGRVSAAAIKAADPDNDGSLDRHEWRRLLRARFRAANTDGDLSIECDELATYQGHILYLMLK
ncbi:MAG: EF-hand domain-containing protein [Hyphomicrobium sp.]